MVEKLNEDHLVWSLPKRLLFLFIGAYFFIYMIPFPFNELPYIGDAFAYYNKITAHITKLLANYALGIYPFERIEMTGSGDTTFDYVMLLMGALLSTTIACVVFVCTRKHKNYTKLYDWLLVYMRYYVGINMVQYGFAKLFNQQFAFPGIGTLEQTYGSSSPMGLLWNFMGYSKVYISFTGLFEILAGLFLFFRKTTVLGCLLTIVIMVNVALLNICYDVPVKILSFHLVGLSLFIISSNVKRVFDFFVLNKSTQILIHQISLPKRWMRITRLVLKISIIVGSLGILFYDQYDYISSEPIPNQYLNGAYSTTLFIINKDTLPPLTNSANRWKKMLIHNDILKVVTMTDSSIYYSTKIDTIKNTMKIRSYSDSTEAYTFTYKKLPEKLFSFSGIYKKDTLFVSFKRKTVSDYELVKRNFHWINEYPYNR